jgi:hypothetical protein
LYPLNNGVAFTTPANMALQFTNTQPLTTANYTMGTADYQWSDVHAVNIWATNLPNKNGIINGDFRVAQRGTSFTSATTPPNSDDTYLLDRWILLSDGNDIVDVSQTVRATPNGSYAEMKAEVETANKQFGFLTILEAKDSARFIGKTVSLSFKARMAAADDNTHSLKAAILSWNSTADTVTSDVVATWQASPAYVANWTAENTPVSKTLTTTEQTLKVEGIAVDTASTKNIAVFIFCDQTDGVVDDAVIITDVQLEIGSKATDFEPKSYQQSLELCKRYCLIGGGGMAGSIYSASSSSPMVGAFSLVFQVEMRAAPTIVLLPGTTVIYIDDAGVGLATISTPTVTGTIVTINGARIEVSGASSTGSYTQYHLGICRDNCVLATAEL